MSIQIRLLLIIALLSLMELAGMIASIVLDAQPRTQAEAASVVQLAKTVVDASRLSIESSPHPTQTLASLVDGMKNLRHAHVTLASQQAQAQTRLRMKGDGFLFGIMDDEGTAPVKIPIEVQGRLLDTVIITPEYGDELDEVWDAVQHVFHYGVLICLALFALTSYVVSRSLRPIAMLRTGLSQLEDGDYNVRIQERGPPEIKGICHGLNTLASTLVKSRLENQRLTSSMLQVQDTERREIARELHDELGPCLFSMRTAGSVLGRELDKPLPDLPKARKLGGAILDQLDSLQQTNRRVLQRLTPPGLQELGLKGALSATVAMWRRDQPHVSLELTIEGTIDSFDVTTELTVYRIVQEALTNAYRHSDAGTITVGIRSELSDDHSDQDTQSPDGPRPGTVTIEIKDDGRGIQANASGGFGMRSMKERVTALAGTISIARAKPNGTYIHVVLPATLRQDSV